MGSDDFKHLNSYLHRIIEFLKKEDRSFTFKEMYSQLGINILSNNQLVKALKNNPKIELSHETLRFVPLYRIRSTEDLECILHEQNAREGIELAKLADSPVDISPFVAELSAAGKIIILKDLDGSEVIFYNDYQHPRAQEEIWKMWNAVKVPNYHDIIEELSTAGLHGAFNQVAKKNVVIKKAPAKRSQRRIKVTNTHVKGLDLTGLNDSD